MSGTIDLSQIPAPAIVEVLDFETILSAMLADLQSRNPDFTALVESDPAYKILEVCAYRETLLRQRVNDAAKGVMLAYAVGPDLDNLAALFGVTRNVITPANNNVFPATPAVMEDDTSLRYRTQLALDGLSTAGPVGAYKFHALTVADVLDVSVVGPPTVAPGNVVVTILSRSGANGIPPQATLDAVAAALNSDDVRPLTDSVTVQAVSLVNYAITATIYTYDGPDPATVLAACQTAAQSYVAASQKIGRSITLSGVYAALQQPGVSKVVLASPLADIAMTPYQVGNCTGITLTSGGISQ